MVTIETLVRKRFKGKNLLVPVSCGDGVFKSDADDVAADVLHDVELGRLHLRDVLVGDLTEARQV